MLRFLKVALVLTLWHSLCSDVEAQNRIVGALQHASVEEIPGSLYLVVRWQTKERDVLLDYITIDWRQAQEPSEQWSLFGSFNTWTLTIANGRNYTYALEKRRLVPDYLGPLFFTITARTSSYLYYQSEEVLYTPQEPFQTTSDFAVILGWPQGFNCHRYVSAVDTPEVAEALALIIRQQSPEFRHVAQIENFACHCLEDSALCSGVILSASISYGSNNNPSSNSFNARNATFYTSQLNQWLQRDDSHVVVRGMRFPVTMATCERYSTTGRQCLEYGAVTGSNASTSAFTGKSSANAQTGSGHVTGAIALVFSLVFMAAALVVLGIVVYLILSKRLMLGWAGKPTPKPNADEEL